MTDQATPANVGSNYGLGLGSEACPTCGSDCNERDELIKAEREIERLRYQVAEWEKLGDPVVLHANLLRGIPCRLDRATFLHLAGDAA